VNETVSPAAGKPLPRWRIAVAIGILLALGGLLAFLAPTYFRNLELQNFVSQMTRSEAAQTQSDDTIRAMVLEKAQSLQLPVAADNVHILHAADQKLQRIDVRYFVQVNLPLYTVTLHFYPGAGSK
jgi:hypothetical protein